MSHFGTFYLDKEKDIVVSLDLSGAVLSYTILATNHQSDNLINNLARISGAQTVCRDGKTVIAGEIPCYIKGDGRRVYIFRLNGVKIANIYPDGEIEVNSLIPAIAKTLMSQTKDYKYSFRETLVKSYVLERVKLSTDLHTHGNANLNADILIALAIKHQIRYPLYYIKKLRLTVTPEQQRVLDEQREAVKRTIDLSDLTGKYLERKIDDNTFINFADLILHNIAHSAENMRKIRNSLSILKDSQAVFTNLEKLYLYRYVFTKGVEADYKIDLVNLERIEDQDISGYLRRCLADRENPKYADFTFYEDTLLWIGREYQKRHIKYVEISDTTLVKKDPAAAKMLAQIHRVMPLVKEETGVDIRFLAAIRRIPLTLVKSNIESGDYLTEAVQALKVVCKDPYVVGHKLLGQEKYIVENNRKFDVYSIIPSLMTKRQIKNLSQANVKGIRISTESQEMGIYKSFNYEIFERRNCVLFAFDGNSSIANLVQEARNGKGLARIFIYPKSAMLKAKAESLEGYVTTNASPEAVVRKIYKLEDNIGTKR